MINISQLKNGLPAATQGLRVDSTSKWWLGACCVGEEMPMKSGFSIDLVNNTYFNQGQPLLLSQNGHVIWNEEAFAVAKDEEGLAFSKNAASFVQHHAGDTLKSAFEFASSTFFPPSGQTPDPILFQRPQYNTWIELMYEQSQDAVLAYAQQILDNGLPPGVLMIDDNWQQDYGVWDFHPGRFSDPKAMIEQLHEMGFKVMLWIAPFVSPDSQEYRMLAQKKALLIREDQTRFGRLNAKEPLPQMVDWWNGVSGVLDFSAPQAVDWFEQQLERLVSDYGVDGFKFDAGDAHFYYQGISAGNITANQQSELFARIGLKYPLNELRAAWKLGGLPIAQRLSDKRHLWEDLQKLVPQMCLEGLMGYPFACPDMIGGGEYLDFVNLDNIDQELIVRSAQAHALMPMMQFSLSPWRVLSDENLSVVTAAVKIRERFNAYILKQAERAASTGLPIMRHMEFNFPHQGYSELKCQFMIGDDLLVSPVVTKNASSQLVWIPEGKWLSWRGEVVEGPAELNIPVTIDDLPYFERQ